MIAPDDITLKLAEKKEGASPDSQSELLKDLFKGVKGDTAQLINAFLFGQNADVTKALDVLSETLNGKEYVKLLNILEGKQMRNFRKQRLFQSLNDFLSRGDKLLKRLTEEQYDLEFTQILSQQVLEKLHEIQNALALHEKHQAQEQLLAKPVEELKHIAEEAYSKGEALLNQDFNYLEALKQFTLCLKLKEKVFGQGGVLTIATIMSLGDVGGALLANGGAYSLTVAEMANFVESCIEKIHVTVYLVKGGLVKEQQPMIFEAFEFLVPLHLLLEILTHKLTLLVMSSKLIRTYKGLLSLLRIKRAFEQDRQIWDWLKQTRI